MSALTARSQLGQIMRRAKENNERFVVDRNGEPQVIIMSVNDFIRTIAPPPEVLEEIWAESKRKGLNKLTMREINAEIAAYRREKRKKSAAQ
ncbi:MAG: type II toxin-antitoxin system Phd/YefM family antitoxin [Acidobacteriota bacterium]